MNDLVIELTKMEQEICVSVGKSRYFNNRKNNIKINIIEGNDFSYKTDIEGVWQSLRSVNTIKYTRMRSFA